MHNNFMPKENKLEHDLISVIVPVYKVEKYLQECLDSILNQTYDQLEIILVDDGSTDNSGAICDQYAARDKRIKVIHKQNEGVSAARNAGLDLAKGTYIAFVDSDDWIEKEMLAKLHKYLIEYGADIAGCNFNKVSENGEIIPSKKNDLKHGIYCYSGYEAIRMLQSNLQTQLVVAWGKIYRSALFKNLRFPHGRNREDEFLAHRLIGESRLIVYYTDKMIYYRQRRGSITRADYDVQIALDALAAFEDRILYFKEKGFDEYLHKPVLKQLTIFRCILKKSRWRQMNAQQQNELIYFKERVRLNIKKCNLIFKQKVFYKIYFIKPFFLEKLVELIRYYIQKAS